MSHVGRGGHGGHGSSRGGSDAFFKASFLQDPWRHLRPAKSDQVAHPWLMSVTAERDEPKGQSELDANGDGAAGEESGSDRGDDSDDDEDHISFDDASLRASLNGSSVAADASARPESEREGVSDDSSDATRHLALLPRSSFSSRLGASMPPSSALHMSAVGDSASSATARPRMQLPPPSAAVETATEQSDSSSP